MRCREKASLPRTDGHACEGHLLEGRLAGDLKHIGQEQPHGIGADIDGRELQGREHRCSAEWLCLLLESLGLAQIGFVPGHPGAALAYKFAFGSELVNQVHALFDIFLIPFAKALFFQFVVHGGFLFRLCGYPIAKARVVG
jgi:hypothetical protein